MTSLDTLLQVQFLDNSLRSWLLAVLVLCATLLVVPVVRGRINARLRRRYAESVQRPHPLLELLGRLAASTNRLVLLAVALYFAGEILVLPPPLGRLSSAIIVFGIAVQCALWGGAALRFFLDRHARISTDAAASASVDVLMFVGQILIWTVFALLALDNLGVNVTALVAGLGVGGIAIALAVQTILGDLFGSLSITLDKPFTVGDMLQIDDITGRVEHIGIKSTRLRSVTGEQVIIANADVLKSRVRNLGRMPEKRFAFRLRLAWDTPAAQVEKVSALVAAAVQGVPGTRFVHCLLAEIGSDALEFEVIYFVANDGGSIAAAVDAVNRAILAQLAGAELALAYPARRVVT